MCGPKLAMGKSTKADSKLAALVIQHQPLFQNSRGHTFPAPKEALTPQVSEAVPSRGHTLPAPEEALIPQDFIRDIGAQDIQPVTERHHLHEYVQFVKSCIQNANEEYCRNARSGKTLHCLTS